MIEVPCHLDPEASMEKIMQAQLIKNREELRTKEMRCTLEDRYVRGKRFSVDDQLNYVSYLNGMDEIKKEFP